jgi:excisionase family DNA binding protein
MSVKVFSDIHYVESGSIHQFILLGVQMGKLLTAQQVGAVTDQTVYRMQAAGKLRSYRVGINRIRFDAVDVEEYLKSSIISISNAKDINDE